MRPILSKELNVQQFSDFYWLKEELQTFCRDNGMSAAGSKIEIADRITTFLQTGEIKKPLRNTTGKVKSQTQTTLSLDTVITENHRCSQQVRAFSRRPFILNFTSLLIFKTTLKIMLVRHIGMLSMPGMKKNNDRKTHPTKRKLLLNLNTISSHVIFSRILTIKGKVVKKQLKRGMRLRNYRGAVHIGLVIMMIANISVTFFYQKRLLV